MKKLISWEEAENLSGYKSRILRGFAQKGKLKVYWLNGKQYRTTAQDLEAFMATQEVVLGELRRVQG